LQANLDRAIDLGSLLHPAPVAPPVEGAQFISGSYTNHAGTRNYKLYIPASYHGQAMPLLVMLHGCTQNPDDFAAGTQMNSWPRKWNAWWCIRSRTRRPITQVLELVQRHRPAARTRRAVHHCRHHAANHRVSGQRTAGVCGRAVGGRAMAVIVGTLYPELFAAVGVHSGLPFASAQDLPSALTAMKRGVHRAAKAGDPRSRLSCFMGTATPPCIR
jgi:hypothetical protein